MLVYPLPLPVTQLDTVKASAKDTAGCSTSRVSIDSSQLRAWDTLFGQSDLQSRDIVERAGGVIIWGEISVRSIHSPHILHTLPTLFWLCMQT